MSLRHWLIIQCTCALIFLIFSHTDLALDLQRSLTAPLNFKFRSWVKKSPRLDPRIKVYAFDDSTLEYLGRHDLSLGEWGRIVQSMAETKPSSILIDKMFGTPERLEEEIQNFQAIMESLPVPFVTNVWVTPKEVNGRKPFPLDLPVYDPLRYSLNVDHWEKTLEWLPITPYFLYGPHHSIRPFLKNLGHAVYMGQGEVTPLYRLTKDRVIPHWSLVGIKKFAYSEEGLYINEKKIHLTERHSILVNFLDEEEIRRQMISFRSSVHRLLRNISFVQPIPKKPIIEQGQYVVILPAMYTGNTDQVNTPQGYLPGGFVMVSMLNSALTGEWLRPFESTQWMILLLVLIGGWFGVASGPFIWSVTLVAGNALIASLSLLCFSHLHLVIPWELLAGSFSLSMLFSFATEMQLKTLFEHDENGRRMAMHQAAQAVQEALIPNVSAVRGIEVAAYYKAAEATGGDWYGIYPTEDGQRIFIFIGDVTGHGFSSALLTGVVSGGIKTLVKDPLTRTEDLNEVLKAMARSINDLVYRTGAKASRSMTMTFACIDLTTNYCHYLNGGHCPPYRMHKDKVNPLLARGDIIGLEEFFRGEPKKIQLTPGDILFFYTDGLLENEGPDGRHLKARSIWECLKRPEAQVQGILKHILNQGNEIWKEHPAEDDCTFFVLRYKGLNDENTIDVA